VTAGIVDQDIDLVVARDDFGKRVGDIVCV
jgi:hypothetical protein